MFHEIWNVTLKSNANVNVKKCDASFASKVLERLLGRLLRFFSSLSVGLCRPFIISLFEPWQHFHWFLNLTDNEVRIRCSLSSVETPNCRSAVEHGRTVFLTKRLLMRISIRERTAWHVKVCFLEHFFNHRFVKHDIHFFFWGFLHFPSSHDMSYFRYYDMSSPLNHDS